MSAEEVTDTPAAAPAAAAATDDEKKEGGKNGGRSNKKDEVPIEELFDLSKPIPKVRRLWYTFYANTASVLWLMMAANANSFAIHCAFLLGCLHP